MLRYLIAFGTMIGLLSMGAVTHAKPTPTAKCAVAKRAAVAKKIAGKLRCEAAADLKNQAVDPVCLAKVEAAFQKAVAKAEAKQGCLTNGDAASLATSADNFVTNLLTTLPPLCFGTNHACSSHDQCCSKFCSPIVGTNGECN